MKLDEKYPTEMNKFKRWWIWIWYNDITRIFLVMCPIWAVFAVILMAYLKIDFPIIRPVITGLWGILFLLMVTDNDYSNLRRIGLTEYRKPIHNEEK